MKHRGVAFKYLEYKNYYDGGHIITLDVCDCCFRKEPSIKNPFSILTEQKRTITQIKDMKLYVS
jgi:hypothetical protein